MADPYSQYAVAPADSGVTPQTAADPYAKYAAQPAAIPAPTDPYSQYAAAPAPEYEEVRKTMERPILEAPLIHSEVTTPEEIQAIAKQHGLDPDVVKQMAPFAGAIGVGTPGQELESSAARGVGLNVPQFITKKSLEDPKMRAAFDDLQDLADKKRSFARGGAELASSVGIGGIANLARRGLTSAGEELGKLGWREAAKEGAKEGAVVGGVAGTARSSEGNELTGGLTGAAGGAAGGAILSGLTSKLLTRETPTVERKLITEGLEQRGPEIAEGTRQIQATRQASDDLLGDIITSPEERDLSKGDANLISREQLGEDALKQYKDTTDFKGDALRTQLQESGDLQKYGLNQAVEQAKASEIVDQKTRDFAQYLTDRAPKTLEDAQATIEAQRESPEQLKNLWNNFTEQQAALEYIHREAVRDTGTTGFWNRVGNFFSDNQFPLRSIDERTGGVGAEAALSEVNRGLNLMSFPRSEFRAKLSDIFKQNKAIDGDLTNRTGGTVARALDSGDASGLGPQELSAYNSFKKYFDEGLSFVNGRVKQIHDTVAPLAIPERANYLPHVIADLDELQQRGQDKMTRVLTEASQKLGRQVRDVAQLSPEEFEKLTSTPGPMQELHQGLEYLSPNAKIETPRDMSLAYKDAFVNRGQSGAGRVDSMARAAMERTGDVPDWMREWNVYKLADKWASSTLRHLYLRNAMDKFSNVSAKLRASGADAEAQYVDRMRQDILGVRSGTAAEATMKLRGNYYRGIDNLVEQAGNGPLAQAVGGAAKAMPDIIGDMTKHVYGNLIGLNPKSLIREALKPFAKTAPELGSGYGYVTTMRGAVKAFMDLPAQMRRVEEQGFVPAEFIGSYRQAVADGIRRSSLYAMPNEVANKLSQVALYFYTKSDRINRAIALNTADMLASDLARGSASAQKSISKMPTAVQRAIRSTSNQGDWADIIGQHLVDSTQFIYNRASMSEYGRTMGPLFSAFTKWPTATAGEIVGEYRNRGMLGGTARVAEKFIAPLVLFEAFDVLGLGKQFGEDKEPLSDRKKKLFGSSGLSGSAPIGSIEPLLKGEMFTPPAIDAIVKGVLIPALNGDPKRIMDGIDSAMYNFTPGSVYVKLLTDDIPTFLTGEKPEGRTFTERTQEGSRIMKRRLEK